MNNETPLFFNKFYIGIDITYELAVIVALIAAKEIIKESSDPNSWEEIIKDLEKL